MSERTGRNTHEQNADALREARRQLDPEVAEIADTSKGVEALEQSTGPDHPSRCVGQLATDEPPPTRDQREG